MSALHAQRRAFLDVPGSYPNQSQAHVAPRGALHKIWTDSRWLSDGRALVATMVSASTFKILDIEEQSKTEGIIAHHRRIHRKVVGMMVGTRQATANTESLSITSTTSNHGRYSTPSRSSQVSRLTTGWLALWPIRTRCQSQEKISNA